MIGYYKRIKIVKKNDDVGRTWRVWSKAEYSLTLDGFYAWVVFSMG
jgi:hypothetical protein